MYLGIKDNIIMSVNTILLVRPSKRGGQVFVKFNHPPPCVLTLTKLSNYTRVSSIAPATFQKKNQFFDIVA